MKIRCALGRHSYPGHSVQKAPSDGPPRKCSRCRMPHPWEHELWLVYYGFEVAGLRSQADHTEELLGDVLIAGMLA